MESTQKIQILVENFISEMYEWEKKCLSQSTNGNFKWDVFKEDLLKIFIEFCTEKNRQNKKSRVNNLAFTNPPSYNIDEEKITSITNEKNNEYVVISEYNSKITGHCFFLYNVLRTSDGAYFIDSKKSKRDIKDSWKNVIL